MNAERYHKSVADYYDEEAASFESRANENHVLKTLRNKFRTIVLEGRAEYLLEIGYGPGLDMVWFSEIEPVKNVYGLSSHLNSIKLSKAKQRSIPN